MREFSVGCDFINSTLGGAFVEQTVLDLTDVSVARTTGIFVRFWRAGCISKRLESKECLILLQFDLLTTETLALRALRQLPRLHLLADL